MTQIMNQIALTRRTLLRGTPAVLAGLAVGSSRFARAETLPNPVIMGNLVTSVQIIFSQRNSITSTNLTSAANAITMMANEFSTDGLGIPAAWASAMRTNLPAIDTWTPTSGLSQRVR